MPVDSASLSVNLACRQQRHCSLVHCVGQCGRVTATVGTKADRGGALHPGAPHQEWKEGTRLEGWDPAITMPVLLLRPDQGVARDASSSEVAVFFNNNATEIDASRHPPHHQRPAGSNLLPAVAAAAA